jgi:diguanylate cyclase (GGDEF)-like protein
VRDRTALRTLVFDSLEEQLAVIDQAGTIVDVNSAWTDFGTKNGLSSGSASAGCNYLEVLNASAATGDHLAAEAARGILDVLSGKRASFYFEYPCHSPEEKRWFMMRITDLKGGSRNLFVISHHNITQRKLAEERAEYLALHDPLTGLANRRYFNQVLGNEMRRGIRNRSAISLIEFDVDYFKDYNDALGHLVGDQCLVKVSQALQLFSRRPGDLAARLGGDEFALLLGDTDFVESQRIGNAIRQAISDLNLAYGGSRQVTISLGVASVIPDRHQVEEFLLPEADKALYAAKSAGRNRVAHVQPVATASGQ